MKKILQLLILLMSFIGFSQNELVMQNGSWTECDFILTDSGGFNDNYGNNEDFTLTLCPNDSGYVTLDFIEFSTQMNEDVLFIYDGDSINSPLIGAFSGVNSPGVIFADNNTGCLTLNFVTNETGTTTGWSAAVSCITDFVINQPLDLEWCDTDGSGIATVDLSIMDAEILGTLNPNDFQITYHIGIADAEANVNPLANPFTTFANPQTICARVEQLATGNYEVACFTISVLSSPIPGIQDIYEICNGSTVVVDTGLSNQDFAFTWFYDGIILSGENGPFLTTTQVGSYTVEVNNLLTGCFSTTDFFVVEASFDNLTDPTPYVICDNDDDGISVFNLQTKTDEILQGNQNPNLLVTYHLTQAAADGFFDVLDPIFTNTIPFAQTLFVRVSAGTGECYDVLILELEVDTDCVSASSVEAFVCVTDPNIPVDFDLTSEESNMLNGQNPSDFTITYYMSETNAIAEVNPIVDPNIYTVSGNSSIIHVRIENQSGSFTIVQIFLNLNLGPDIFLENTYTICENGFVILTPSVTGSNGYSFLWNTGATDPEILATTVGEYSVEVTDLNTGCVAEASTLVLEGEIPVIVAPSDVIECTPNATFDLTTVIPEVLNGMDANNFIISFFNNINDALSNVQQITNPSSYVSPFEAETIYIRVQNSNNDCFEVVEFDVINEVSCPVLFDCAEGPIVNNFCYNNNFQTQYVYESIDGLPLQVEFIAGQVENNFDELVILDSDGITNLNPEATTYGNNGNLTGLIFTSTGSSISISVTSDGSVSCITSNYTPIEFAVSCVDVNAIPNCNVTLQVPQDGSDNVDENTELTWTAATGLVEGYKLSLGITSGGTEILDYVDVGNVLTYDPGTLDYEITYYLSIIPYNVNGDAEDCVEKSFTVRPNPNQMVVCDDGPVNTTYCYENDDTSEFSFQSGDGQPLTIFFNAGGTEVNYDEVYVIDSDGTILNEGLEYGNAGDFTGLSYTSSGDSLTVRFDSDFTISCGQGSNCCTVQFDFDVYCSSSVGIIEVNAFVDDNVNSIFDANEFSFSNGYFTYEINGDGMINTVNSSTGHFQIISTNDTDVYEITFNLYQESAGCYDVTIPVFNNITVAEGSLVTVDFPVVEEQSCEDLAVYLINYWTPPRPGFSHENYLVLENLGFTTISSGTVEFVTDPQLIFNGVTSVNPNYVITNTATGFTVDFVNLQPGDVEYINISLTCPAEVELGEIVTNTANYVTASNDLVPGNNFSTLSELVVGSWDPNDKMEAHGPRVLFSEFSNSDEWLYYTIRFQNLGTFPATYVRIDDQLDSQLDETTFQMLRSSHDYVVTRTNSSLEWFFDNIDLPAEQDDPEGSNGFVYFRVKPKVGYAHGDVIPNTAAIFFDFNEPVITNRFETVFVDDALSISEVEFNNFELYPNPATDILNIKLNVNSNAKLSIYDIQGQLILDRDIEDIERLELNVSNLQSGLYFVKLNTDSKELVKKLIIE